MTATSCGALPPKTNELDVVPCAERERIRALKSEKEREKRAEGQDGVEGRQP